MGSKKGQAIELCSQYIVDCHILAHSVKYSSGANDKKRIKTNETPVLIDVEVKKTYGTPYPDTNGNEETVSKT
jgi:hypothetical protein